MHLQQYYLSCLAQASYLICDEESGQAVVVDPRRDITPYIIEASERKLTITHVILTHFHADFISGHIELRDTVGAKIALGSLANPDYDFLPLNDGDIIDIGSVRLQVLSTPGHTPEAISILVFDLATNSTEPHAVLTGDTLFIGDVGRPDLMASVGVTAQELAADLYDSIHKKLLPLPDTTIVYPGHGAGSFCGRALSNETASTIGEQRLHNYALQPMEKDAFIHLVTADQLTAPDYFAYDADLNRRERDTLDQTIESSMNPLDIKTVVDSIANGAQLLDVRDGGSFAAGHFRGAINVGLGGQYAIWAGTVLDHDRPIILITEPSHENEAMMRLGRIGFDNILGYLEDGMAALKDREDLIERFDRYDPSTLHEKLQEVAPPLLLDVRGQAELVEGRIDASLHIPLNELPRRLVEIPRDREIAIYCAGGYRSVIAASLLRHEGILPVADLAGGYGAWQAAMTQSV